MNKKQKVIFLPETTLLALGEVSNPAYKVILIELIKSYDAKQLQKNIPFISEKDIQLTTDMKGIYRAWQDMRKHKFVLSSNNQICAKIKKYSYEIMFENAIMQVIIKSKK